MQTMTNKKIILLIAVLAVFVSVTVLSIYVSTSVYVKRSDSKMVRILASWLPAAKVGGQVINYGEFLKTRDTVKTYLSSDAAKEVGMAATVTSEVEKNSLERIMREIIVTEMAKEKGVTVSDEDVRASFTALTASTSSTIPNVAEYLSKNFNWTEEEYRDKVIKPAILEERVAATMGSDINEQIMKIEEEIKNRMAGKDVKIYLKF